MKLRTQLLTLSLATVLVPWFGWKLVQELEQFLRAGQESALLASARTVAQALPLEYQSLLQFGRDRALPLRVFDRRPIIDGYQDDWPEPDSMLEFSSADGQLRLQLLAGVYANELFLLCRVTDATPSREQAPGGLDEGAAGSAPEADGLNLYLRSARGLNHFRIRSAAPGPLVVASQADGGGQLRGYWLDIAGGYQVEMALPPGGRFTDLSVGAVDAATGPGRAVAREAGTLQAGRAASWLSPAPPAVGLQSWLQAVVPEGSRAWVLDPGGWVVAATGLADPEPIAGGPQLTWAERTLYRAVAGARTEPLAERPDGLVRFSEAWLGPALVGQVAQHWGQDSDNAQVRHSVAVPIELAGQARGALVVESRSDGLALVTNRALGRLLLTTLALTLVMAAGLWLFATRLSRRVQRLSGAVSAAMDDAAQPSQLPLVEDADELGELARNNTRLLRAVADYTAYLQKLAGRLSHELKTPLAITRSSLENLATREHDPEALRYLDRAREGVERQAAIIRAMSEASRLEAAVQSADWEVVDLAALLRDCTEAYRALYTGRELGLQLPSGEVRCRCIPDLLVQALDKLVDNAMGLTGPDDRVDIILEPKGNYCHLKVRNTGTCLPDTLQDQLFDSLVSVRDPRDGALHLGLGLHIVRLVAQAHNGRVEAANLPGGPGRSGGVVFTISLPAS